MASDCMECVESRAVALGLCSHCLAGEPVEAVVRQIARLARELEEVRRNRKWEADHQQAALAWLDGELGTSLAEEFPFDCDTIEHVAEALIEARRELEAARERERGYREALENIAANRWTMDVRCIGMMRDAARRALASTPPDTEDDDV